MAIKCPKCGAVNPDNARFCWNDGENLVTTGFTPFRFTNGSSANSIEDLIPLIEQNWDESKRYLYSDSFSTWFSSIGRGDLTLAAQDIAESTQDQDTALRKLIRRLEDNPTFRFRDGTKASTISEFVAAIDQKWEEGKHYLYNHDDLADWLETIQRDDLAKKARQIISSESDKDIGLEKFLQSLGSYAPPNPQLTISPSTSTLDFGTVNVEKVPRAGYTVKFTIRNAGRGYLYGTITSSESWVTIDNIDFSGTSTTVTVTAEEVGRSANITIQSNGGTETFLVKMNPVYPVWKSILGLKYFIESSVPWYRIGVVKYAIAFILIGLCELFPAIVLVSLMSGNHGVLHSISAVISLRPLIGLGMAVLVFPALGPLIGLGMALLVTRTQMTDEDWKAYGTLFWTIPLYGFFILSFLYIILFILLVVVLGVEPNKIHIGFVILIIAGHLITCLIAYHKAEKGVFS